MEYTNENLVLLKQIVDSPSISIQRLEQNLKKDATTIRKMVKSLNEQLPNQQIIKIRNNYVSTAMTYQEYLKFVTDLNENQYITSAEERCQGILILAFFHPWLSLSQLYQKWGLSITTKKKDTVRLRKILVDLEMKFVILRRKGITICGDELTYRLLVVQILLPLVDINRDGILFRRLANNPFERFLCEELFSAANGEKDSIYSLYHTVLEQIGLSISYTSKKMLLLYLTLLHAQKPKLPDDTVRTKCSLPIPDYHFLSMPLENMRLNIVLAMLDYLKPLNVPVDPDLKLTAELFFDNVSKILDTEWYPKPQITMELYRCLYQRIFLTCYHIRMREKLLANPAFLNEDIRNAVLNSIPILQSFQNLILDEDSITNLVLILQKWTLKNRIIGKSRLRIVLVTNTSGIKCDFFVESLKEHFDFRLISILDLNEIYQLKKLRFDLIITLSERSTTVLRQQGYKSIRLHLILTDKDQETLKQYGVQPNARRFIARNFAMQMQELKTASEMEQYLLKYYPDYFL